MVFISRWFQLESECYLIFVSTPLFFKKTLGVFSHLYVESYTPGNKFAPLTAFLHPGIRRFKIRHPTHDDWTIALSSSFPFSCPKTVIFDNFYSIIALKRLFFAVLVQFLFVHSSASQECTNLNCLCSAFKFDV